MSETPGPRAIVALGAERSLGDGPLVEHGVHMADEQHVRTPRPAEPSDEQVSQLRRIAVAGPVRAALDLPATRTEPRFAHVGDRVHAGRGVGAAVDVHHRLQRGDEIVVAASRDVA